MRKGEMQVRKNIVIYNVWKCNVLGNVYCKIKQGHCISNMLVFSNALYILSKGTTKPRTRNKLVKSEVQDF